MGRMVHRSHPFPSRTLLCCYHGLVLLLHDLCIQPKVGSKHDIIFPRFLSLNQQRTNNIWFHQHSCSPWHISTLGCYLYHPLQRSKTYWKSSSTNRSHSNHPFTNPYHPRNHIAWSNRWAQLFSHS